MTITKSLIAFATLIILMPSGAAAASLYGGSNGTASVTIGADVSAGASATGSPSSSSAGDDSSMPDTPSSTGLNVSVTSASSVSTEMDLADYRESVMEEDAAVAEVDAVAGSDVTVSYWHEGRLFGIFPVKVKSETTAALTTDGDVAVTTHMPWWNMFVTGTGDARAAVDEELSSSTRVAADLKMKEDAAARARLIEAIVAAHAAVRAE